VIFVKFLRKLSTLSHVRDALGFTRQEDWDKHLRGLLELAYEVERLAPEVAPGPNPEYPWPRQNPTIAPVGFDFPIWPRLQDDGRGRKLRELIKLLLSRFAEWF
jgi:hypothetical protein